MLWTSHCGRCSPRIAKNDTISAPAGDAESVRIADRKKRRRKDLTFMAALSRHAKATNCGATPLRRHSA